MFQSHVMICCMAFVNIKGKHQENHRLIIGQSCALKQKHAEVTGKSQWSPEYGPKIHVLPWEWDSLGRHSRQNTSWSDHKPQGNATERPGSPSSLKHKHLWNIFKQYALINIDNHIHGWYIYIYIKFVYIYIYIYNLCIYIYIYIICIYKKWKYI